MEGKMPKNFEPDGQFVDKLEWQLASEFRRMSRLKPSPGKVAVPRYVVAMSLAAGVLLAGVAATKASDLIKDSWRKKIEVARLETEVKIKTAFMELKRMRVSQSEEKFSMGLIDEDALRETRLAAGRAEFDLNKSLLDLEEAKVSGDAPCDELYAPLVGGRDFVSERLEIDKKVLEADIDLRRTRSARHLKARVDVGLLPKSALDMVQAALAVQEGGIGDIEKRLTLRRNFLSGGISAEEMEIQDRMTGAEKDLREARSKVDTAQARLSDLRAKEAAGMVSEEELRATQMALDAAQAQVSLAMKEIEILKTIR
jgi:hypothetical protein